jgi:uncharacterized protein YlxW (UPF0749 family)
MPDELRSTDDQQPLPGRQGGPLRDDVSHQGDRPADTDAENLDAENPGDGERPEEPMSGKVCVPGEVSGCEDRVEGEAAVADEAGDAAAPAASDEPVGAEPEDDTTISTPAEPEDTEDEDTADEGARTPADPEAETEPEPVPEVDDEESPGEPEPAADYPTAAGVDDADREAGAGGTSATTAAVVAIPSAEHTPTAQDLDEDGFVEGTQIAGHQDEAEVDEDGFVEGTQIAGHQDEAEVDEDGFVEGTQIAGHQDEAEVDEDGFVEDGFDVERREGGDDTVLARTDLTSVGGDLGEQEDLGLVEDAVSDRVLPVADERLGEDLPGDDLITGEEALPGDRPVGDVAEEDLLQAEENLLQQDASEQDRLDSERRGADPGTEPTAPDPLTHEPPAGPPHGSVHEDLPPVRPPAPAAPVARRGGDSVGGAWTAPATRPRAPRIPAQGAPAAALESAVAGLSPRMRLLVAMRPRATRAQLLAMLLCFVLGLAGFLAVKQNQSLGLDSMRQSDLVSLLDNVTEKSTRLEDETRRLQTMADQLKTGSDKSAAALEAAQQRLELLGILAGTSPATGPGIKLTITDPKVQVTAATLLDSVQELRDAGAEAIQVGGVRVVANTSFVDGVGGVRVDGTQVPPPYVFLVIGDSQTLAAALGIPGGVLEVLKQQGATGMVEPRTSITVSALRQVTAPQYARPATSATP